MLVFLTIAGETMVTTPNHPFFTVADEWVAAGNLQPGDEIRDATWGTGTVEAITFTATPQTMYNFTVATAHTYFVGQGQWLVHNSCAKFDFQHVQSKFDRHASDFGITGNWSKANGERFQAALDAHVHGANTTKITGTYRGTIDAIHYFDPATSLNVITDLDGNFISGWKLSDDQIKHLLNHGNVQ